MKKAQFFNFILMLLAIFAFNACASVSTMQTPGVVPKGELRWAIASTGTGGDGEKVSPSAEPNFEVAARYGVAENFDIGLKLNLIGVTLSGKYQFLRGDWDMAVGLEAGYQWLNSRNTGDDPDDPSTHVIELQVPLLTEYHFNPYVGIAFGPKLLGILIPKTDNRSDIWNNSGLYLGIMAGLPLRLTKGVWFMPEFNIYSNLYDGAKNSFTNVLWQAGVSVFFGGL